MAILEEFAKLGVSEEIQKALEQKGYVEPTPIQKLTIPVLLQGETDLVAQAQTGTGKTAAFSIPMLEQIRHDSKHLQALVLTPTRELCMQTAAEMESMKGETGLRIVSVYGGQPIGIQLALLRPGADIVIGTPGRVMDLMDRGVLHLEHLKIAVLDEADEMLDMGFREDMEAILSKTPVEKQMLMFSATMPREILSIAEQFMRDYKMVRAEREKINPNTCEQIFYEIQRENKPEALARILDMHPEMYSMIFCKTRSDVNELSDFLMDRGYSADAIHGEIVQSQRTRVINNFKAKRFRFLIATDVAARGIDVDGLTHVINYSVPQSSDAYVHRIGRTARAGKTGAAITLITPSEFRTLQRIKRESGAEIRKEQLPNGEAFIESRKNRITEKIQAVADKGAGEYLNFASELLTVVDHPAQALAAVLQMHFGEGFLDESSAPDLNAKHIRGSREGRDEDRDQFRRERKRQQRFEGENSKENTDGDRSEDAVRSERIDRSWNRFRDRWRSHREGSTETGKHKSFGKDRKNEGFRPHKAERIHEKPFDMKDFDTTKATAHFKRKKT